MQFATRPSLADGGMPCVDAALKRFSSANASDLADIGPRVPASVAVETSDPLPRDWAGLFDAMAPRLRLYARQFLDQPSEADDVVQNVFLAAWKRSQGEASRVELPLLFVMCRSRALDWKRGWLRRLVRQRRAFDGDHPATGSGRGSASEPWFDADPAAVDDGRLIAAALEELEPRQREVVVLRIWGQLTFAEIADVTGDSLNTVASRYRYALKHLRRRLEPHIA